MIESDNINSVKVYTSWRWLLGFLAFMLGELLKIFCLPYIDLTLVSANAGTDIMAAIVFSVWLLKEKFNWRYDLPSLTLFIIGGVIIVLCVNKTETDFNPDVVKDILTAPRTLVFLGLNVFFTVLSAATLKYILHRLRVFENDVDEYHRREGITGDDMILPEREKKPRC